MRDETLQSDDAATNEADALRLWLRLFAMSNIVQNDLSRRLRREFDMTLPRFDLLAQLHKAGSPITLGELSRRLMVTNGNVTGLIERLVENGWVSRHVSDEDRRAVFVKLTDEGKDAFEDMAAHHRVWVEGLFGDLAPEERAALSSLLSKARAHLEVET